MILVIPSTPDKYDDDDAVLSFQSSSLAFWACGFFNMTTFQIQSLSKEHFFRFVRDNFYYYSKRRFGLMCGLEEGYECGCCCRSNGGNSRCQQLGSDLPVVIGHHHPMMMGGQDESRTESANEEAGSSSGNYKEEDDNNNKDYKGWLQLSLGGGGRKQHDQTSSSLVELDLLSGGSSRSILPRAHQFSTPPHPYPLPRPFTATNMPSSTSTSTSSASLFLQQQYPLFVHPNTMNYWGFRPAAPAVSVPVPRNFITASVSSSSSSSSSPSTTTTNTSSSSYLMPRGGNYFSRPFLFHGAGGGVDLAAAPPRFSDLRVVDLPPLRRPHSGLWFMLQASQNQAKEPFLDQIPKNYLRIKDGRMTTVRLLMKYLANKLSLDDESQVEITCRGQQLVPFLTIEHVRDHIWSRPRNAVTSLPDLSTSDHVMVLNYGRRA